MAISLLALMLYSSGQYLTNDPLGLTLFQQPVLIILNYGMLVCLLGFVGLIWLSKKLPWKLRLLLIPFPIYAACAFAYAAVNGSGVEDTFLGVDAFAAIPYYFLQSSYLAMNFLFPIGLLWSLACYGVLRKTSRFSFVAGRYIVSAGGGTKSGKKVNATLSGKISEGGLVVDLNVVGRSPKTSEARSQSKAAEVLLSPENVEIVLDASNSI